MNDCEINFEELMKSNDWWVLNGSSSSFDLKEEIKAWGGYWVKDKKRWRIDGISQDSQEHNALRKAGLCLRRIEIE